jgi:hypothetical protein
MRNAIPARPEFIPAFIPAAKKALPRCLRILFLTFLTAGTLCATGEQPTSQPASPKAAAHKPVHHGKRPVSAHTPAPDPQAVPAPVAPPAPKPPDWPINDHPTDANVVWNSQGLRIEAANSSLKQILKDVAVSTGIKVQGLETDERIFGAYGPGKARDVLVKLLDGSGYNVLMIGDQGEGTPRQILLTTQPKGDTPPAANGQTASNNEENSDADEQPEPQPPPPNIRNGLNPGAPPRTPQQIMQEMQQRQQQQMQQNNPQ